MKNLVYFIIYLITNSIVAQAVIVSEEIAVWNDSIQIPGTLSYDSSLIKQPLVIFVHGSGKIDRNGNQKATKVKANYIKLLSEELNKNGIAFYRFDKRTSINENYKYQKEKTTINSFKEDVQISIDHFKDDQRFSSLSLIGHSQGSLVALIAVNKHIDKYISLAGLGQSFDNYLIEEYRQANPIYGAITEAHLKELKTTGKIEEVAPFISHILAKPNQDFVLDWIAYDPSEELKKLNIPILILNGTKDLQTKVNQAKKLHDANPKSQLKLIEGMNHVLKTIEKDEDNLKSYSSPDYPLSEELVTLITDFIKD